MLNLDFLSSNVPAAAAAAAFAAAITAAYASLKYYSDKAAKVTDFRKAWIESLRQAVAEFSGSTHTIAGRIATKMGSERQVENIAPPNSLRRFFTFFQRSAPPAAPVEKELATELLTHWSTLRLSYNKIVLHLNPAEHLAYSLAETAIAKYTPATGSDDVIREQVSEFLKWCIELAQSLAKEVPERPLFSKRKIKSPASCENEDVAQIDSLEQARFTITNACADPGSALLLAAFATRQLLHGRYENVFKNVKKIEQGIRVVDTAAAIVIKGVWENIKKGEPTYRRTSHAAMIFSILLIVGILASLLTAPVTSPGAVRSVISCSAPTASPPAGKGATTAVTLATFTCETITTK